MLPWDFCSWKPIKCLNDQSNLVSQNITINTLQYSYVDWMCLMGARKFNLFSTFRWSDFTFALCDFETSRTFLKFWRFRILILVLMERTKITIFFNIEFFLIGWNRFGFRRSCFIEEVFRKKIITFATQERFWFLWGLYCIIL